MDHSPEKRSGCRETPLAQDRAVHAQGMDARRAGSIPAALATEIFQRSINRKLPSDEIEGQIGKAGVLGLGFGAAAKKFYSMVIRAVRI